MIDLIYKTLLTIINKENQGYVSPTEFNILANQVQMEIFRDYFEDENRDKVKKNKGYTNKGYANLDFNTRQKISKFAGYKTLTAEDDLFKLPSDLYFIEDDGVLTPMHKVITEIERGQIGYLFNSLTAPTELFPVYENIGDSLKVYPDSFEKIQLRYTRIPKKPMWTYFVLPNGSEVFDPSSSSFQDFELHETEFSNIVNRMLTYFGINLREAEVIQIAEQLKGELTLKDNQ